MKNSNQYSLCCNVQATPSTQLDDYNGGLCPKCNDFTGFEEVNDSNSESKQEIICGFMNDIWGANGIMKQNFGL